MWLNLLDRLYCFQSVKVKKFESNSQRVDEVTSMEKGCFHSVKVIKIWKPFAYLLSSRINKQVQYGIKLRKGVIRNATSTEWSRMPSHTWKWCICRSCWYLSGSEEASIPGVTFPGTPAVVKPHYTHLWGTSVTAGVHKSATPANGLSLEYIHLQDVMHIAQLQVCRGWRGKQARLRGKKDLNALREHMRTAASDQPLLRLSPTYHHFK